MVTPHEIRQEIIRQLVEHAGMSADQEIVSVGFKHEVTRDQLQGPDLEPLLASQQKYVQIATFYGCQCQRFEFIYTIDEEGDLFAQVRHEPGCESPEGLTPLS